MVPCTSRTLLKGKHSEEQRKHSKQNHRVSICSSSPEKEMKSTTSVSDDATIDNLVWPSKREDCEWMADKVSLGGKHAEMDSEAFKDDIVSYGVRSARGSSKARRKQRSRRGKATKKANSHDSGTVTVVGDKTTLHPKTRQPLGDITTETESKCNETSPSTFRPAYTVPMGWHRALFNMLSQADKDRSEISETG
ncbi:uncharacterized protein FOMMEDRAFT_27341 [Fomitiporia mediterranea MF3/22]|uniref:uncharacterized protein n=1 Tax=Fomitiporia mediterranea (strain MF3/22) TaxID=694068 RepID=UPI0004407530|nr:uncharacterized protein FOMMEDRAFT_27341 [Fomitiporia mediterranea MF3/22]EJD05114.1 hypothetical protein FOMMEDRAFT_27341 [Fomitiporia mediterranea MF3/22]